MSQELLRELDKRYELPQALRAVAVGAQAPKEAIAKTRYTHDAMIDLIIAEPEVSQGKLAKVFGFTEPWVSRVISSDAFQAKLAERKDQIIDPILRANVEECFRALVMGSLDKLMNRISRDNVATEDLLKAADIGAKVLGYGARGPQVAVTNQFVVQVPGKAQSSAEWARAYSPASERVVHQVDDDLIPGVGASSPADGAETVPAAGHSMVRVAGDQLDFRDPLAGVLDELDEEGRPL